MYRSLYRSCPTLLLLFALHAGPAAAYVVFLKDGSQIATQEKYTIEGDMAILTLRSGTISSIPISEIDVAKTDELNKVDLGIAKVIEGMEKVDLANATPPPPPRDTIADLILAREDRGLRLPDAPKRKTGAARDDEQDEQDQGPVLPLTPAGYTDLEQLERAPYAQAEVSAELKRYLQGQGIDRLAVYRGTSEQQPLLEIEAASESEVFKALSETANALLQARERFPEQVAAVELLLVANIEGGTANRSGQFLITPELADLLAGAQISPAAFFVRYVEF